jgi:alkylated DNA nucleotide flippase Atl1
LPRLRFAFASVWSHDGIIAPVIETAIASFAFDEESEMASVRAAEVAELLWEIKRADKVGTFTRVARKAGFSPGVSGRTIQTVLKTVRRDWPHLQWWRVFPDDGLIEKDTEQSQVAEEHGFTFVAAGDQIILESFEEHVFIWQTEEEEAAAKAAAAGEEE